jgi:ribosomal protein L30/L7E
MVFEIIAILILASSLGTIVAMFIKKAAALKALPAASSCGAKEALASKLKAGVKKIPVLNNFSYELFLQKMLSRFRVLSLKTESKTSKWLEMLRQKKTQKGIEETENKDYWDKLKKAKDDR